MAQDQIYTEIRTPTIYISHIRRSVRYVMHQEHAHAEWELYHLLSGERRFFIRDHVVSVRKGEFLLIPAGEIHKSLPVQEAAHERISVEFRREFLDPVLAGIPTLDLWKVFRGGVVIRLKDPEHQWVQRELFRILAEVRENTPEWEDAVRLMLSNILLYFARCDTGLPVHDDSQAPPPEWFPPLLRYLSGHYMEHISLSDVAAQFFLHPSYLSRAFRRTTGMTFMDYLAGIRVREARRMLESTQLSLREVGDACGFEDGTRFGRVFKRLTGQTPGGYRKSASRT